MYIENLRKRLTSLNSPDYEKFKIRAYNHLINNLDKNRLKKGDFQNQLNSFMEGSTKFISFDNLNSYLYALDMINKRGAQNAMFYQNRGSQPNSWRDLLIKITEDQPFPKEVKSSHFDESNISILKSIMKKIIIHTSSVEIDDTNRRLVLFNEFLNEFFEGDK